MSRTPNRGRQRGLAVRDGGALVLIGMVGLGLRFVGLDTLPLIGDESYYWLWSRHLDWAYYDHPAGVALVVRGSTALGGKSPFGVRWLNALIGAGAVLLTWLVGRQLLSRRAGLFSAAAVAVGAPYLITSRFVYTNALVLFLALLNLLAFWEMAREEAGIGEGLAFGVTLALLFNAKYSGYVHAAAVGAALLLDHRDLLSTRRLWLATSIGIVGLVPVVVWNVSHDWASFRWQLTHLTRGVGAGGGMLGTLHHAWVYLTGPLILLAAAGLGRMRTAGERLLTLVALFLLLPVVASPANSPRNLSTGLVPLLMLAGSRLPGDLATWPRRMVAGGLVSLFLAAAIFGIGTVAALRGPSPLPQSSIVPAIRRDAAGWPALGAALKQSDEPIFALDYSIASQIAFYAERPAYTAWGQYRMWGIPSLEDATVVALDYLDSGFVTGRLRGAFEYVEGPERLSFNERGATKVVYVWRAHGLRWEQETFLRRFDFLTMLGEAG